MNKITEWALSALEHPEKSEIETVVETPWSSVMKIKTKKGNFYLKQTPPSLFIEVDILKLCRNGCHITDIPELVAENKALNCFIMRECGDVSLRTFFEGKLNVDILVEGLQLYKTIQKATTQHIDEFIKIGVPDWRLEQFPKLYQELVNNDLFMKTQELDSNQIKILQSSVPKLEEHCQKLSSYGIPDCLNHSDFHENNMVISLATKKVYLVDLGETAINHPFFSLAAFLTVPCKRYDVSRESETYQKLHDTCFEKSLLSPSDLQKALSLTETLLPIYLIFAQMRLVNATDPDALRGITRMKNRIKDAFIWFINNLQEK